MAEDFFFKPIIIEWESRKEALSLVLDILEWGSQMEITSRQMEM